MALEQQYNGSRENPARYFFWPSPTLSPFDVLVPLAIYFAMSSPDSSTVQTLVLGIAATLLAVLAIYLSYRQLQAMRRLRQPSEHGGHEDDVMELPLVEDFIPRPNVADLERNTLTARVFTFQQYDPPRRIAAELFRHC